MPSAIRIPSSPMPTSSAPPANAESSLQRGHRDALAILLAWRLPSSSASPRMSSSASGNDCARMHSVAVLAAYSAGQDAEAVELSGAPFATIPPIRGPITSVAWLAAAGARRGSSGRPGHGQPT